MSRNNHKKSRLKYVFLAFTCATAFAFSGIASACKKDNTSDDEKDKTTTSEDTQLLKNGNFEFFTIPETKEGGNDPEYLIKTPTNWSHGGTSSYSKSGIISTSKTAWDKMVADGLAEALDYNNSLDSSSSNYLSEYVDYNGMTSNDILYKDQYKGLQSEDDATEDKELEPESVRKQKIANPETHYKVHEKDGKFYAYVDGEEVPVYVNEDGEYFLTYDKENDEYSEPISNILMLHNYATSHNGIAQNYSSVDVELPANTAAEVSVWVKTSNLKFSQGKQVVQDRGANISVRQTVGGNSLDRFTISCINTEKLLGIGEYAGDEFKDEKAIPTDDYNGWIEYTIYINACDFAATTISIELGLGESGYTTEGYAFFDDVTVTKYVSLEQSKTFDQKNVKDTTCVLSSDASDKVFKADTYKRNEGAKDDKQYSENLYYLIDLASEGLEGSDENKYVPVSFSDSDLNLKNLKAGFTVDEDNYVSSKNANFYTKGLNYNNIVKVEDTWRLPFSSNLKDSKGLKTDDDYLAVVKAGYKFLNTDTHYYEKLNKALNGNGEEFKGVAHLPKISEHTDNNMLVMLSSYGAAYTTSFDLSIPRDSYQIVSFWVKTSDMGGSTAATVKITQSGNDDNTASFNVDTTNLVTNIGKEENEKDIYDGWVQCFFFVHNELEAEDDKTSDTYTVEFSFGNTTIKGTDVNSYKNGWVALANMQYLSVDEEIYSYTGSGDHTASLTISEEAETYTKEFDSAYANQSHEIKDDMVILSSYKGVNGKSSAVYNNGHVSIPFDEFNNNEYVDEDGNTHKFTGLINREHFVDGNYDEKEWYNALVNKFLENVNTSGFKAIDNWNAIFGTKSYQPLVITNRTRTSYVEIKGATEDTFKNGNYYVKNDDGDIVPVEEDAKFDASETYYSLQKVRNYGYIGEDKSVSSDSYSTISVRVRASKGAIAYVYLVDTSAGKDLLSFGAPHYSFYYDEEGNVLREEPKANATTTQQRENILYTLRDNGLYEDENGNLRANTWNYSKLYYVWDSTGSSKIYIENIKDGETYTDENGKEANHYLVTSDGTKVYEYINGAYHYIVEGKTQSEVVSSFDTKYARYDFSGVSEDYVVRVDGNVNSDWVTVTYVIHAGSEAKSYRLELWSGRRDQTGVDKDDENANAADGGVVLFDYSYTSVSNDDMKGYYEKEIINAYLNAFAEKDMLGKLKVDTTGKNIAYYEKLAKENNIKIDAEYTAHYYTYSLYDSANFQPFNKDVASDGATGYDYSVSAQSETLAYLQVKDGNEYTIFADYSAIDKSISLNNPSDTDTDNKDEDDKGSDGSVWLLISSIVLVIALVFAIIAIFVRDAIKKARRNKVTSKNNYDQRKANRYKKKLHLQTEETIEVDNEAVDGEETTTPVEEPVEETPAEEAPVVEEAPAEEPVEEAPVEEAPVVEETPAEAPAEEATEAPAEGEDKPE